LQDFAALGVKLFLRIYSCDDKLTRKITIHVHVNSVELEGGQYDRVYGSIKIIKKLSCQYEKVFTLFLERG